MLLFLFQFAQFALLTQVSTAAVNINFTCTSMSKLPVENMLMLSLFETWVATYSHKHLCITVALTWHILIWRSVLKKMLTAFFGLLRMTKKKEQNLICFKLHYALLSYPVNPFFFLIVNTHTFFRILYYCKFNNFLLQTCALFGLYCLGFITSHKLCNILFGLLVCTFVLSFVFVDRNNIIV